MQQVVLARVGAVGQDGQRATEGTAAIAVALGRQDDLVVACGQVEVELTAGGGFEYLEVGSTADLESRMLNGVVHATGCEACGDEGDEECDEGEGFHGSCLVLVGVGVSPTKQRRCRNDKCRN